MHNVFKPFKNISNFKTDSIYLSGLNVEGYEGYDNSDRKSLSFPFISLDCGEMAFNVHVIN